MMGFNEYRVIQIYLYFIFYILLCFPVTLSHFVSHGVIDLYYSSVGGGNETYQT